MTLSPALPKMRPRWAAMRSSRMARQAGSRAQGADLVLPHQPAVAFDIGGEDRRELADRFCFLAHRADKANSLAVRGANEALFFTAVADRAVRPIDTREP